jgi:deoxyribodipyrimidine photolyase
MRRDLRLTDNQALAAVLARAKQVVLVFVLDPAGRYVRRWVHEVARVADRFVHDLWKMPLDAQHEAGCILG